MQISIENAQNNKIGDLKIKNLTENHIKINIWPLFSSHLDPSQHIWDLKLCGRGEE